MPLCKFHPAGDRAWECRTCETVVSGLDAAPNRRCSPDNANLRLSTPRRVDRPMVPCCHRGAPTGQTFECQLCGQRGVQVPVLACAVHGECVHSKFLNAPADLHPVKVCMGPPMCKEREE